jgi:hypothetical protein
LAERPIKVTPTDEGFTFDGLVSFADYDFDLGGPVMKDQEVTGRIDRRVQKWCPQGDGGASHGLTIPLFGRVRARTAA